MSTKKNAELSRAENNFIAIDFDIFTENSFINGSKFGFSAKASDGSIVFIPLILFFLKM
jgi:hypothetical protein